MSLRNLADAAVEAHQRSLTQYAVDQMFSKTGLSQEKQDDWNALQKSSNKSVRELERAHLAARQDLAACQLEFKMAHRDMADVVYSAASMLYSRAPAVGGT